MDKQYIKVQDHDNLFRDPETGAIINKNKRPQNSLKEVLSSNTCLLYTSPSPRDATLSRMPSSA